MNRAAVMQKTGFKNVYKSERVDSNTGLLLPSEDH